MTSNCRIMCFLSYCLSLNAIIQKSHCLPQIFVLGVSNQKNYIFKWSRIRQKPTPFWRKQGKKALWEWWQLCGTSPTTKLLCPTTLWAFCLLFRINSNVQPTGKKSYVVSDISFSIRNEFCSFVVGNERYMWLKLYRVRKIWMNYTACNLRIGSRSLNYNVYFKCVDSQFSKIPTLPQFFTPNWL